MARLLLAWMSTEAVKTQSLVLVLGKPLTEFMCQWDMQDEAIALVVIERGSAIRWIGSLALCFSSSRRTEGRTTRHGSGTPSSNRGTGPPQVDHCAEASSSPGGKEENTGSASKLSYRLTMGSVEVSSIDPVKLVGPNRVPHTVRLMTSGQQCPNDAGQHLPSRIPAAKPSLVRRWRGSHRSSTATSSRAELTAISGPTVSLRVIFHTVAAQAPRGVPDPQSPVTGRPRARER